jgi:hypothetical protein
MIIYNQKEGNNVGPLPPGGAPGYNKANGFYPGAQDDIFAANEGDDTRPPPVVPPPTTSGAGSLTRSNSSPPGSGSSTRSTAAASGLGGGSMTDDVVLNQSSADHRLPLTFALLLSLATTYCNARWNA